MNKTYTINVSGFVFNIDDDAYQELRRYLDEVKKHFSNNEDSHEILSDIESRIAEIFSERINSSKQVINLSDVNEVIGILGKASDFESEEEQETDREEDKSYSKQNKYAYNKRKLYRDVDDNVIGGVAKGLSYFFGIDVTLIRIVFLMLIVTGTAGFWIYVILWAIIPEAKTSIQKMEMKGEPINLSNLEKNIREEFKNVSETLKNKKISDKINFLFDKLVKLAVGFVNVVWSASKYILGSVFILIGVVLLSILVSFFIFDQHIFSFSEDIWINMPIHEIIPLIAGAEHGQYLLVTLLALIAIPLISLLFTGIRILLDIKTNTKAFNLLLVIFWIFALITFVMSAANIAKEFQHRKGKAEEISFNQKLYIKINDNQMHSDSIFFADYDEKVVLSKQHIQIQPIIRYKASKDSTFKVRIIKKAFGMTKKQALNKVDKIDFNYSTKGDTLYIDRYSNTPKLYRGEHIVIQIFKPEDRHIESNLNYIFDDVRCYKNAKGRCWEDDEQWEDWD